MVRLHVFMLFKCFMLFLHICMLCLHIFMVCLNVLCYCYVFVWYFYMFVWYVFTHWCTYKNYIYDCLPEDEPMRFETPKDFRN